MDIILTRMVGIHMSASMVVTGDGVTRTTGAIHTAIGATLTAMDIEAGVTAGTVMVTAAAMAIAEDTVMVGATAFAVAASQVVERAAFLRMEVAEATGAAAIVKDLSGAGPSYTEVSGVLLPLTTCNPAGMREAAIISRTTFSKFARTSGTFPRP